MGKNIKSLMLLLVSISFIFLASFLIEDSKVYVGVLLLIWSYETSAIAAKIQRNKND